MLAELGMFSHLWNALSSQSRSPRIPSILNSPHVSSFSHNLSHSRTISRRMSTESYTETWLAGPGSTQFYTRTYTLGPDVPTKAVVVALHGFAEHVARYVHFHPLIAARGIAVFAFDQRGFGLTAQDTTGKKSKESAYGKTSWREQMADIEWTLGHAKKTYEGVPLFLLGHSMVCHA